MGTEQYAFRIVSLWEYQQTSGRKSFSEWDYRQAIVQTLRHCNFQRLFGTGQCFTKSKFWVTQRKAHMPEFDWYMKSSQMKHHSDWIKSLLMLTCLLCCRQEINENVSLLCQHPPNQNLTKSPGNGHAWKIVTKSHTNPHKDHFNVGATYRKPTSLEFREISSWSPLAYSTAQFRPVLTFWELKSLLSHLRRDFPTTLLIVSNNTVMLNNPAPFQYHISTFLWRRNIDLCCWGINTSFGNY